MSGVLASVAEAGLRGYSRLAPSERGAFRLVRAVRRLRRRESWRGVFRTPQGLALELDLATYPDCCMAFGLYELTTARLIRRLLKPGDHFIDGGANLGYFTLLAAQRVGSTGRVDAFEPQPDNLARLRANLARNGLAESVRVHALALMDRAEDISIHYFLNGSSNHGCSSIFARPDAPARSTRVPGRRMDEVLAGTRPTLVKLDVEGAEPLAVRGMKGLFGGRTPPMVIVEFNAAAAQSAGFSGRQVVDDLLGLEPKYEVFRIGWRAHRIDVTDPALARLGQCNLLFVRWKAPT